jgi:hypothetical protein
MVLGMFLSFPLDFFLPFVFVVKDNLSHVNRSGQHVITAIVADVIAIFVQMPDQRRVNIARLPSAGNMASPMILFVIRPLAFDVLMRYFKPTIVAHVVEVIIHMVSQIIDHIFHHAVLSVAFGQTPMLRFTVPPLALYVLVPERIASS